MFLVNDAPPIRHDLLEMLRDVEPPTIGHFKQWGFMDAGMKSLMPERRVVGSAFTIRAPGADGTIITHAMGLVRPGDFVILDRAGDKTHAGWGGVLVYAARLAGVVGVAIDGLACDLVEIREANIPLWYRGTTAITTKRLGSGGEVNVPVSCGGVTVHPGDIIVGDESGIVVLKPDEVAAVAEKALAMQSREVTTKARLDAGEKLSVIAGTEEILARRNAAGL